MEDSQNRITTYHPKCAKYDPDTTKPQDVENVNLGKIYECKNFVPRTDLQDFWQQEVDDGKKYCATCINYHRNQ